MRYIPDNRLRFGITELDSEWIEREWSEFTQDMESGVILDIEDILADYYDGRIDLNDIISTFPPSELPLLNIANHKHLITSYSRLIQEFPYFYG